MLNTGVRRGDAVRAGRQHLRGDGIVVKVQKPGKPLVLPVAPELQAAADATPMTNMTFLLSQTGASFKAAGFGNAFPDWCDAAGLPQCSAHGLRKAISRRLADAGCDVMQLAAVTGHASLKELEIYIRARDQKLLARRAMGNTC